jgi:serine-type D-Ala-D-Ala carboxypeptidase/endopeptidase (penicillin-binding protein 4)
MVLHNSVILHRWAVILMNRYRLLMLASAFWLLGWATAAQAQGLCRAQVASRVDALANQPALSRARLGILVETLAPNPSDRQVIYTRDAQRYFVPASNVKLLTTAAALQQLGPNFAIATSLYTTTTDGQTTLYAVGRGDPTFTTEQLQSLVSQIQQRGITQITSLLGDDSHFPGPTINPNWEWEDIQAGYGAPVNSLILNENELGLSIYPQAVGQPLRIVWDSPNLASGWQIENFSRTVSSNDPEFITVGRDMGRPILRLYGQLRAGAEPDTASVAIPNPAEFFVQQLRSQLNQAGIRVGPAGVAASPLPLTQQTTTQEIARVTSAPLAQWLVPTNRNSNNLYAEALLKTTGLAHSQGNTTDATEAGTTAIKSLLAPLGVDPNGYALADGSGLSRHNLATPETFVDTLQGMAFSTHTDTYRNSLAVAGQSGTLRNRFRETPVEGRFWGKTGAISNNVSLSGYFDPPHAQPLVVSILVNNGNQSASALRRIIDDIVLELAKLNDC